MEKQPVKKHKANGSEFGIYIDNLLNTIKIIRKTILFVTNIDLQIFVHLKTHGWKSAIEKIV